MVFNQYQFQDCQIDNIQSQKSYRLNRDKLNSKGSESLFVDVIVHSFVVISSIEGLIEIVGYNFFIFIPYTSFFKSMNET